MNQRRWRIGGAVGLLLAAFAALTIASFARQSATYDETSHLPAGYSYLCWNDYRLNPEHPPLIKKLCALPLLFLPVWPESPALVEEDLRHPPKHVTALRVAQEAWAVGLADNAAQWYFGHVFLYGWQNAAAARYNYPHPLAGLTTASLAKNEFVNDADRLLFWGRLPVTLLGVLLGLLIFVWARDLFGVAGGFFALALFCFDPNFIAHSGLVTTDVGAAFFIAGTVYFLWRTCVGDWCSGGSASGRSFPEAELPAAHRAPATMANGILAALFCAMAFAAKFTAVVLLPVFVLLGAWQVWRCRQRWAVVALRYAGLVTVMLLVSWGGLWAVYGFRYSSAPDPQQAAQVEARLLGQSKHGGHHPMEEVVRHAAATKQLLPLWPEGPPLDEVAKAAPTAPLRWSDKALLFAARYQLVPESYLFGFAWAEMKSQVRSSFLRGRHSNTGFWNYFLWTFLLKTPVLTLLAIVAALVWAVWRRQGAAVWLLMPPVVHLGISMTSNMNIGHRHLLTMYPFLFVLCGGLTMVWRAWLPATRRVVAGGVLGLVLLGAFVVWWRPAVVYPNYLAYFNELAGGPRRGAENLVDSNLDWGQDLPRLKQWLDDHQVLEPIALCYFGMADPVYHGISYLNLPGGYPFAPTATVPSRGYLVVSATNLKGVYFSKDGQALWQQLLRRATLIDTIGYSLFIFRLDPPAQ